MAAFAKPDVSGLKSTAAGPAEDSTTAVELVDGALA
jgi:hypothetical protein